MSEAAPNNPSGVHYHLPDEHAKHHGASIGLIVVCIILVVVAGILAYSLRQQDAATADVRAQLDRANSDTASAKADLAKAGASLNDAHAQLETANRQQSDLKAQIEKLTQSNGDLQAQLQKAQTDLKTQQETAQSQLTDLQGQLSRANDASSGLRSELAAARSQADNLKTQLAKAEEVSAKPQSAVVARPRELPLISELKKSFWSGTFTLELKNSSPNSLKMNIGVTGSSKPVSRSVTIEGSGSFKLGDIAPGSAIAITSDGFSPITMTAGEPNGKR